MRTINSSCSSSSRRVFVVVVIIIISVLLVSVYCVSGTTSPDVMQGVRAGGRHEIAGAQNDLQLQNLAKFAVEQHYVQENSSLVYVRLVSAEQQVVAGTMYYLELEATLQGGTIEVFEAKVWVKPWQNFQSLEGFKEIRSAGAHHDIETNPGGPSTSIKGGASMQPVLCTDEAAKEAAEQAMATLQKRSNSLIPYEFKKVISVHAQVSGKNTSYDVMFIVQRGSEEEQVKAEVMHIEGEAWTVKDVSIHH